MGVGVDMVVDIGWYWLVLVGGGSCVVPFVSFRVYLIRLVLGGDLKTVAYDLLSLGLVVVMASREPF